MQRFAIALGLFLIIAAPAPGQNDPMPPERTAALMQVPDGFHVCLFAGEPDVVKPIAMTLDDRGRLWVVESHSYPKWIRDGKPGKDRILIFEDTKGTGHFDKRTVFLDNGTNLSGIALGFGGVWLCATPNLLFVPIKPGEDKPAGPPEILLDGWSLEAQHNVFNTLVWGPDGWLYGCNGILATSKVGKPGTPDDKRIPMNCGVWRYHPTRKLFEVFAWGTTNPWGLDYDSRGEMIITNCVIKHLFHVVQGGHYERMYGQDLNPHVYQLMQSCADHFHWAGGDWTTSRGGQGAHSDAGGGHAHAGCMIYQGDNWPDEYRGKVFMGNIHGNRINMDALERKGSGYVAHHGKDFLTCSDPWFRPLALISGPDGVYLSDWHDTGECHNYEKTHPSGRIYKIKYGKPKKLDIDLAKLGDEELVKLQSHKDEWRVRQTRRLLQERAGSITVEVRKALRRAFDESADSSLQLRALLALHAVGDIDDAKLQELLKSRQEDLRGWAIRLMAESHKPPAEVVSQFAQMAKDESSASVRLALATALQRLPAAQRRHIAINLAEHEASAADANLPYLIWYGLEPAAALPGQNWAGLVYATRMPLVRRSLARRLAGVEKGHEALTHILRISVTSSRVREETRDILHGMHDALRGQSQAQAAWPWGDALSILALNKDKEIAELATLLCVLHGDVEAVASLRETVRDRKAEPAKRTAALQTLVEAHAPQASALLRDLLADHALRGAALRGLAAIGDDQSAGVIIRHYAELSEAEKVDAIATLTSRPTYAIALLEAMEAGTVPRRDLSAFAARQLLAFKDPVLANKLTKVWGTLRTGQDKSALLAKYYGITAPEALKMADRSHGRFIFNQTCAKCHTLFGEGGKVGPDLTGSQRANNEYLLAKLLDPSAVVAKDYQLTIIATKAGRSLSGIVKEENDKVVSLQTENEVVRIAKADIDTREQSKQSMMPEGQLEKMSDAEVRDLFAYLAGSGQVTLPKQSTKQN
jgi:putative membrane-bound dehydrogenase-like protein